MALIACIECKAQISERADKCPQCGAPQAGAPQSARSSTGSKFVILFTIIALVAVIANLDKVSGSGSVDDQSGSGSAVDQPGSGSAEAQRIAALTPEQREAEAAAREAALNKELGLVWRYGEHADAITKGTVKTASVRSLNEIDFDSPYQGSQRGELQLRKHPRYGSDVILSVERGQFLCRLEDCTIAVRFDDGKPQTYDVAEPTDNSSTYLFVRNYSRFLANVRKAKKAHIEAQFFQQGPRVFEFDVSGLEWK